MDIPALQQFSKCLRAVTDCTFTNAKGEKMKFYIQRVIALLALSVIFAAYVPGASAHTGKTKHLRYSAHHGLKTRIVQNSRLHKGKRVSATPFPKMAMSSRLFGQYAVPISRSEINADRALYLPAENLIKLAKASLDAGDLARAAQLCQEALAVSPVINGTIAYDTRAYNVLGHIALAQGDNQDCLDKYAQAFANSINQPVSCGDDAGFNIALAYCRLGDYDTARAWLDKQDTETFAEDADCQQDAPPLNTLKALEAVILLRRSETYSTTGHDGLPDAAAAQALLPGNPAVEYNYGSLLKEQKQFAQALPHLKSAKNSGHGRLALCAQMDTLDVQYVVDQQAAHPQPVQTSPVQASAQAAK